MLSELSPEERERYARHLVLTGVGLDGQLRLRAARVLVVGAGGLGSPILTYLAAAGVGTIGIVDDDRVDLSNLQRQVIHGTPDIGRLKTESAIDRLTLINPDVQIEAHTVRLVAGNATTILDGYEVVVDGTDNFATQYLISDACVASRIPYVWAAVDQFAASLSVLATAEGPCYRCIFPHPPEPGDVRPGVETGILGALPGMVGAAQAMEAVKLLLEIGRPLVGRLGIFDGLAGEWEYLAVSRDPGCQTCGARQ